MIPVFRNGKIYNYDTTYGDRSWSQDEHFIAAAFFATSVDQGYEDSISYTLAYMYISLIKQPELNYESLYLEHIKKIMDHVERA